MKERFVPHPAARLFDAAGEVALVPVAGAAVLPDRPGAAALLAALGRGAGFRIGAGGGAPGAGEFETLTSGSTGAPRRIRRSVESWTAGFAVNAGLLGIGPGLRLAVPGRLSQSLALYGALEGLCLGAEVHLLDGLRPDRQVAALAARRVQALYATPAQLRLMAEAGGRLADLRLVLVGGSRLDAALRAALAAMAPGAALREFYGAAEASFITLAGPETPWDSVGTPYPGVEVAVRDDLGRAVAEGGVGTLWVRSPYLFTGYAGADPGGVRWDDGWLSVGEMGSLRGGHLYLAGRAGRMVTVADQNVFPEEIETALLALPGVARAAVLARPDALRGHVMIAVCMGDPAREAEILRAARGLLGPLKAPRALVWRQDWPQTLSGKTDLRRLEEETRWP
jgi:long-chain acyl-CoA synthetase